MGYYFENYLHDGVKGERRKTVTQAVANIKRYFADGVCPGRDKPDFIAVCGASGLSVGAIIAYELGVPCVIVRKVEEARNSHCGGQMLTPAAVPNNESKYVIVDDFIAGGNTVKYIKNMLKFCTCVGYYGYGATDQDNADRCKENYLTAIPKA